MWRVVRLSEDLVSNAADKSALLRSLRCDNQEGIIDLKTPFVDLYTKYLWVSEFLKSRPVYVGCHRLNRYINHNGRWSKLKRRHWCRLSFTVTCPLTWGSCKAGTAEVRIMCTDPWRGKTCEGSKHFRVNFLSKPRTVPGALVLVVATKLPRKRCVRGFSLRYLILRKMCKTFIKR